MKHNCSLWKPSPLRLSLLMLGAGTAFLLVPDAADAAITAGEMGLNIADNAKGVAKGITMAGFATGIGMGLCGGIEMFKAAKERNDGSYKSGMVKVLIGSVLLGLGEALGSGSATLFGSDQTSGLNDLSL